MEIQIIERLEQTNAGVPNSSAWAGPRNRGWG